MTPTEIDGQERVLGNDQHVDTCSDAMLKLQVINKVVLEEELTIREDNAETFRC